MPQKIKTIARVFVVLAVLVGAGFLMSYQKRLSIFSNNDDNPMSEDRISFLLLGETGRAIGWSNAPDLTDSIILVDYRPRIGVVNLVSLPRDLWVNFGGESFKLNEALRRGKLNDFMEALPQMTGLKTDKYIVVNVDILKKIVDELGGVDLTLKDKVVDGVSGYTIQAGDNHINGTQAVWLSRNRYAPEGDFFREKNQQEMVRAILKKFKGFGMMEKTSFLFKMTPELGKLNTNIDFKELLPNLRQFGSVRLNHIVVDFKTGVLQSSEVEYGSAMAYILVPRLGAGQYEEMRTYVQSKIEK
jgi:LCP family protein required for cell wall assembly